MREKDVQRMEYTNERKESSEMKETIKGKEEEKKGIKEADIEERQKEQEEWSERGRCSTQGVYERKERK